MDVGMAIDDAQGLSEKEQVQLVSEARELGYSSAWTPSRADATAFDRCIAWHSAAGLDVGISAVPASGQAAHFYAEHATRAWVATQGRFTLAVGGGQAAHPADFMRRYIAELRTRLPSQLPLYVAALGPLMLEVAGQVGDGVALNWCTSEQVAWSRDRVAGAAHAANRPVPSVIEYIRTCVDADSEAARGALAAAASRYALGPAAYRRHFQRMGLSSVGAAGAAGEVRQQFEALAHGLDLAIVRIVTTGADKFESARRALEECRPGG